jgi:hypothetical protein
VTGRAAAGVDDAAVGVASLEAERELAVGLEVEEDAARAQLANRGGCLGCEDLDSARPAQTAARGERVGGVALRRVAWLERRGEAALGPVAGAERERGARDEADVAPPLGCLQGGPEAGRAAADDDDVELRIRCYRCPASRRIAST